MFPKDLIEPCFLTDELGIPENLLDGANLGLIVGNNASGKSLLRRYITIRCKDLKIKKMYFSQESRCQTGIERALIYGGSEETDSTGCLSIGVVMNALGQISKNKEPMIVIFDEPEIGLSEESQAGLALYMREALAKMPESLLGSVVVTHSRHFIYTLKELPHNFFCLGDGKHTAETWLQREIIPSNPKDIRDKGLATFRKFANHK